MGKWYAQRPPRSERVLKSCLKRQPAGASGGSWRVSDPAACAWTQRRCRVDFGAVTVVDIRAEESGEPAAATSRPLASVNEAVAMKTCAWKAVASEAEHSAQGPSQLGRSAASHGQPYASRMRTGYRAQAGCPHHRGDGARRSQDYQRAPHPSWASPSAFHPRHHRAL
eukprot:TRINITY_DN25633_c0_g1_i1.p1 TRINITY_DN25633_c0_g1~~TRINITY_DN25633_c0_g1_i1.p1  ORF type:complete len:168 (+),score=1.52 TRINITY_DN25633_c0_g1_i1:64-567(+)